jgi:hypothetical protein
VLALLSEHREIVRLRLRIMVNAETGALQRAGLLLLLGLAADQSEATSSLLADALSGDDLVQRRGAALAFAHLKPDPLPDLARVAILDAISAHDLEDSFRGLPWDVMAEVGQKKLYACLDATSREEAAVTGITAIESGNATRRTVSTVLGLVFSLRSSRDEPCLTRLRPFSVTKACRPRHLIRDGGWTADILPVLSAVGPAGHDDRWRALATDDGPDRKKRRDN